jgi:hypothetical protein
MTTNTAQRNGGQTHYWLACDQASCGHKQVDAALSPEFCLSTAAQMGWRSDPNTNKDYCPDHVPVAELDIGHAFVKPDKIARG